MSLDRLALTLDQHDGDVVEVVEDVLCGWLGGWLLVHVRQRLSLVGQPATHLPLQPVADHQGQNEDQAQGSDARGRLQ